MKLADPSPCYYVVNTNPNLAPLDSEIEELIWQANDLKYQHGTRDWLAKAKGIPELREMIEEAVKARGGEDRMVQDPDAHEDIKAIYRECRQEIRVSENEKDRAVRRRQCLAEKREYEMYLRTLDDDDHQGGNGDADYHTQIILSVDSMEELVAGWMRYLAGLRCFVQDQREVSLALEPVQRLLLLSLPPLPLHAFVSCN